MMIRTDTDRAGDRPLPRWLWLTATAWIVFLAAVLIVDLGFRERGAASPPTAETRPAAAVEEPLAEPAPA